MPKRAKHGDDFTKASIKRETKEILKKIAADENLYEYELIEAVLKKSYPRYFKGDVTECGTFSGIR